MTIVTNNTMPSDLLTTMNPGKATTADTISQAQDRFMTLLVAQMRNQDPLNPLDNAQVTSQLAQLSTVTGIDKLNATLQALQTSYQSSQSMAAANMIGHGVLVPGSNMILQESKGIFGVELTESADNVLVEVRDAAGKLVHTKDLGSQSAGTFPLTWDGKMDNGSTAADGRYTVDVIATRGEEKIKVATALAFGEVASVSTGAQGVKLNIAGQGSIDFSQVRQIL